MSRSGKETTVLCPDWPTASRVKGPIMTGSGTGADRRWAIVLAGGEGERIRPLATRWLGHHRPKQYCTFVGSRSMLQHTLDRTRRVVHADRIVTVIGRGHSVFLDRPSSAIPGRIIEQPANRDTVAGIFLPATYVLAADPLATVLIFPSDHFVFPEDRFLRHVERAALLAERFEKQLVLLGATPDGPEPEYGWIEPGPPVGGTLGDTASAVARFHEKPARTDAERFHGCGYLWNTMVLAVKVKTLWALGHRFYPDMIGRFEALRQVLHSVRRGRVGKEHEAIALSHVYRDLESANFSRGVLERAPQRTTVVAMPDVDWSDWGRPERIARSLARLGRSPAFPLDCRDEALVQAGCSS